MDDETLKAIREALSADRMNGYRKCLPGPDAGLCALRLYVWNIEVSAAMFGPLHVLEVVMRNGMHQRLQVLFQRADWWNAPQVNLHGTAGRMLDKAKERAERNKPGRYVAADVVPELTFGFWVGLLGRGNDYETRLWRPALSKAFPGFRGRRTVLHHDLEYLRTFRNRIMHHEPIHYRHLEADHATLLRVIGQVSPEVADCIRKFDRVPEVLAKRSAVERGDLPPSF